jgi:hypothetical protein
MLRHGAYRAGRRRVTVRRPNNTTFTAQLYYPATATGDNAPYDGSGAPYPAVSFGHGFLQPPERYRSILEHLATWGYLTIATESGLELFPNHRAYAEDMRHCLTYLEEQNADVLPRGCLGRWRPSSSAFRGTRWAAGRASSRRRRTPASRRWRTSRRRRRTRRQSKRRRTCTGAPQPDFGQRGHHHAAE